MLQAWQDRALALIDSAIRNGQVFGATFFKADGTVRTGSFQAAYHWDETSSNPKRTRAYAREQHGNVKAVDMNVAKERGKRAAIRTIPTRRLTELRIGGKVHTFPGRADA